MAVNLKRIFPNVHSRPKQAIIARTAEVKRILSGPPLWMVGNKRKIIGGVSFPRNSTGIPFEFTRDYYRKGPHDFRKETRMSSEVHLMNLFALPLEESGVRPFQLFCKTKERVDIKQAWEYLMLDLWSHLLRYYSQVSQITLKAPQSFKLEGSSLYMAYHMGTIGDHLHKDFKPTLEIPLRFGEATLYQALALHLGAMAHIKESEEISHGDYRLRHFIFDPGGLVENLFYYVMAINSNRHTPTLVNNFITCPALIAIDMEGSLREPNTRVQEENDKMFMRARAYAAGHNLRPRHFERFYRDGYDRIEPQGVIQQLVDQQYQRYGVSVDNLF